MDSEYRPPLALTVLSAIFLGLGAACAVFVAADIAWRRGWRRMMSIMIPVYIINATYFPLASWIYFQYGRPPKTPSLKNASPQAAASHCLPAAHVRNASHTCHDSSDVGSQQNTNQVAHCCHSGGPQPSKPPDEANDLFANSDSDAENAAPSLRNADARPHHCHRHAADPTANPPGDFSAKCDNDDEKPERRRGVSDAGPSHCHHHDSSRPLYATVLVGVSHCGAGCVLGDLVGEWLVYGTDATINGQTIWAELLVDYAFALLFGIAFQYFSIAPMSGDYGPKSLWRAAKADVLSLTSFEIGCFGWMVAFQVGIWNYRLSTATWTYWWMMQIGMAIGFLTATPMNWWLISHKIKEPCA